MDKKLTNEDIVNQMMKDINLYKGICYKITNGEKYTEDIIQDVFVILLEYNNEELNKIFQSNKIKYVVATICRRLKYNPTSKFNILNRHEKRRNDFDISTIDSYEEYNGEIFDAMCEEDTNLEEYFISNDKYNNIITTLEHNFDWYSVELFKMYWKIGDYNIIDGCKRDLQCKNEHSSYRKMGKRTGIHYLSIQKSVSATTKELKRMLTNKY